MFCRNVLLGETINKNHSVVRVFMKKKIYKLNEKIKNK